MTRREIDAIFSNKKIEDIKQLLYQLFKAIDSQHQRIAALENAGKTQEKSYFVRQCNALLAALKRRQRALMQYVMSHKRTK